MSVVLIPVLLPMAIRAEHIALFNFTKDSATRNSGCDKRTNIGIFYRWITMMEVQTCWMVFITPNTNQIGFEFPEPVSLSLFSASPVLFIPSPRGFDTRHTVALLGQNLSPDVCGQ